MISHILSKEQFLQFQTAFRARANAKNISASDIVLYNVVRGKDKKHGFSPITNATKLANGTYPWLAYTSAEYFAKFRCTGPKKSEYFKGLYTIELTEEQFKAFYDILNQK